MEDRAQQGRAGQGSAMQCSAGQGRTGQDRTVKSEGKAKDNAGHSALYDKARGMTDCGRGRRAGQGTTGQ